MGSMIKSEMRKKKQKIINFKVSEEEYLLIKKSAKAYLNGNVSGWIRYASTSHKPRKDQLARD